MAIDASHSDACGEIAAVALTGVGLLLSLPTPLAGLRYWSALLCVSAAPIAAVLFHEQLPAQVWSVVPLMFIAIFIRTWHTQRSARVAVAALAVAPMSVAYGNNLGYNDPEVPVSVRSRSDWDRLMVRVTRKRLHRCLRVGAICNATGGDRGARRAHA